MHRFCIYAKEYHRICLCSALINIAKWFSKVIVQIYIAHNNIWEFKLLHILANIWHWLLIVILATLVGVKVVLNLSISEHSISLHLFRPLILLIMFIFCSGLICSNSLCKDCNSFPRLILSHLMKKHSLMSL